MALKLHATSRSIWRTAFLVGALTVMTGAAVPDGACAEGLFDFLFGGFSGLVRRRRHRLLQLVEWPHPLWVKRV